MEDLYNKILNNNIAEDTSNILIPDNSAIKSGIVFKSNINSNVLNGYLNLLSEAIQYLQFTGGLYSEEADYDEGNIVSLVIKNGENYSIWQFRRNSNNLQVLNNNPPITGASITTVNGIDIYEGGTLNTDWDKLTEDYDIEATPNTVMIRDEEGASNVNMPSNIENTTVINNEYLQSRLSTKQDKLTAGTNVEITEDNVINVKGDVATAATQVSQTNEALGANVQTALDSLKTKYDDLQNQITIITDEKLPDIYDYSGVETFTNKKAKFADGSTKPIYRKCIEKDYAFIKDGVTHYVAVLSISVSNLNITKLEGLIKRNNGELNPTPINYNVQGVETSINLISGANGIVLGYIIGTNYTDNFKGYKITVEYYK